MWLEGYAWGVLNRAMPFLLTMTVAASLLEMKDSVAYKAACHTTLYLGDEPILTAIARRTTMQCCCGTLCCFWHLDRVQTHWNVARELASRR